MDVVWLAAVVAFFGGAGLAVGLLARLHSEN